MISNILHYVSGFSFLRQRSYVEPKENGVAEPSKKDKACCREPKTLTICHDPESTTNRRTRQREVRRDLNQEEEASAIAPDG